MMGEGRNRPERFASNLDLFHRLCVLSERLIHDVRQKCRNLEGRCSTHGGPFRSVHTFLNTPSAYRHLYLLREPERQPGAPAVRRRNVPEL